MRFSLTLAICLTDGTLACSGSIVSMASVSEGASTNYREGGRTGSRRGGNRVANLLAEIIAKLG